MAIFYQTLTNPGAESGSTTGWTSRSGGAPTVVTNVAVENFNPHSGTYMFKATASGSTAVWDQEITIDGALFSAVDAGTATVFGTAWHRTLFSSDHDTGALYFECYDSGHSLLDSHTNAQSEPNGAWVQESVTMTIPANTRYIRIGTNNVRHDGTALDSYWDDFVVWIEDVPSPKATQLGVYALAFFDADKTNASQLATMALGAAETSTGIYDTYATQLGIYALCRGRRDVRRLRAWTFPQDDHIFYVLQLGDLTLVFDKLTEQWAQWKSPDFNYWRGADGCAWEGFNVCCDTESGIIWKIDAIGRKDYTTNPIESKIIGGMTERFRTFVPCYMAELAVSEGAPPSGIDASTLTITLRSSQDAGQNWTNHGSVTGEAIGDDITVRWYGLGLMKPPGHMFEIVDTGYARRIDGLNIELGNYQA